MKPNRLATTTGAVAALLALAACSKDSTPSSTSGKAQSTKHVAIAWFSASATNTFNAANLQGIKAEAAKSGATVTTFSAEFDPTKQINQVQDAVVSGKYKIFVINPLNAAGLAPPARTAVSKGITVVSILGSIGPNLDSLQSSVPGVITVGQTFSADGKNIASQMVKACADKNPCRTAYMTGDPKQATEQIRVAAVHAYLKKYPNVKLVSEQAGGFDARTGLATAQNILTANPNLDVLGSSAGQSAIGALQALQTAGLLGKVKVVSNGATKQEVDAIRKGTIFAAPVYLPVTEGRLAVQYGVKAVQGEKVPTVIDESKFSPIGALATKDSLETPAGKSFTGEYSAT